MALGSIVEAVDEGEGITLGLSAGLILAMMDEFGLGAWKKLSVGALS